MRNGLKELWVKAGVGESVRFVPLHTLYDRLGADLCSVLPAVHSLTGCDIASKVGTKHAALKADPVKNLRNFGTDVEIDQDTIKIAEKYLVQTIKRNADLENMNDLRSYLYHQSKVKSHRDLPPTSHGILPHIKRAFYNSHCIMHSIAINTNPSLMPDYYQWGFVMEEDVVVPEVNWRVLEEKWTIVCSCSKCARSSCPCRVEGVKCTNFCKCMKKQCKNPFH